MKHKWIRGFLLSGGMMGLGLRYNFSIKKDKSKQEINNNLNNLEITTTSTKENWYQE